MTTEVGRGSELGSCRKQSLPSAPITGPSVTCHISPGTIGKRTCRLARLKWEGADRADIIIFLLLIIMLTYYCYYYL